MTDGVVQLEILETIGNNEEWLLAELEKEGYDSVQDIFIAEYDKRNDQRGDLWKEEIGQTGPIFFPCKKGEKGPSFSWDTLRKIVKWTVSVD